MFQGCFTRAIFLRRVRKVRKANAVIRVVVSAVLTLQIFNLSSATQSSAHTASGAITSEHRVNLKVIPTVPLNGAMKAIEDYGTPLGAGLALVTNDLADDASMPVIPRPGLIPSESPIIEASVNQILAPIIQSLPTNSAFKTSIFINGHAVKYATHKASSSSTVTMPAFVGTLEGTFLFQITTKQSKFFYKVTFTPEV